VADAPERPRWNEDSFFKRFASAPGASAPGAGGAATP
jgi:hypothetical protein